MSAPTRNPTAMRRTAARLALLLAALIIAACGDDNAAEPTARATLGAAGGNLSSPDGSLVLTIPAGALGNDTEITITEVAVGAVPEHLKAINADRVYRLGPAGTQFAKAVTATVALAAGNQLAVMLIDSNGATAYAANQQATIGAQGRRVLGELTHFSHLLVRTVGSLTGELTLDKRELKVGDTLTANAVLSKLDADDEGIAACVWFPGFKESSVLELLDELSFCQSREFTRGTADQKLTDITQWKCTEPGNQLVSVKFLFSGDIQRLFLLNTSLSKIAFLVETDVTCTAGEPTEQIATGTRTLTTGTQPDGVQVYTGEFNGKPGPWLWIAVREGVVLVNLVTGLTEVNLTNTGAGALGGDNFDVATLTDGRVWGVMALGRFGGALRSLDAAGNGSLTQSTQQLATDAATLGGNPQAEEMAVTQRFGIDFVRKSGTTGLFDFVFVDRLDFTLFVGRPISATPTSTTTGSPIVVLIPGTDSGTTSTIARHDRQSVTARAEEMFKIPDPNGRRVRCAPLRDGRLVCIVTAASLGKAWKFILDPARPTAPVTPEPIEVGPGSVGVQFATGSDGTLRAALANLGGAFNGMEFGRNGSVTANRSHELPAGTSTAHVAPFANQGEDYFAGASKNDNAIFVLRP